MLGYMIKRAVCNKWMVLACAVSTAIFYYEMLLGWLPIIDIIKNPNYYNGLTELGLLFALCSYCVFAGMFPGLPYGGSLLEERNSGFLYYVRQRISMKKYMRYKIFAVGISGAVSTAIPVSYTHLFLWEIRAAVITVKRQSGGRHTRTVNFTTGCMDRLWRKRKEPFILSLIHIL